MSTNPQPEPLEVEVTREHREAAMNATYPNSRRTNPAALEFWVRTGNRARFSDGDTYTRLDRVALAIARAEQRARLEERESAVRYLDSLGTPLTKRITDMIRDNIRNGDHVKK